MSVVEGGAQKLPDALAALIKEQGGEVHTGHEVEQVLCERGRAVGVRTSDGSQFRARRAVVAGVGPRVLYERLLASGDVPPDVGRRARAFRYGPGTLMMHLALNDPLPWAAGEELADFGYVHVAPYAGHLARTYAEAQAGLLPADPLLIVGQTSAIDPARSPEGKHMAWIQVRTVPSLIRGTPPEPSAAQPGTRPPALWPSGYSTSSKLRARGEVPHRALGRANTAGSGGCQPQSRGRRQRRRQTPPSAELHFSPPRQRPFWLPHGSAGLYLTGAATWPGGQQRHIGRLAAQRVLRDARRSRLVNFLLLTRRHGRDGAKAAGRGLKQR